MGNKFGNYKSEAEAVEVLKANGFTPAKTPGIWAKPSTDGFGFPMTALVEVTTGYVAGQYTASGVDETYYQHHFLG